MVSVHVPVCLLLLDFLIRRLAVSFDSDSWHSLTHALRTAVQSTQTYLSRHNHVGRAVVLVILHWLADSCLVHLR